MSLRGAISTDGDEPGRDLGNGEGVGGRGEGLSLSSPSISPSPIRGGHDALSTGPTSEAGTDSGDARGGGDGAFDYKWLFYSFTTYKDFSP